MQRPAAVTAVSAVLFAAAAIAFFVSFAILFPLASLDSMWELNKPGAAVFRSIGRFAGVLLLALGTAVALAARALGGGKRWAWWFATALFSVDACGDLAAALVTHQWIRAGAGVAVSAGFLRVLARRDVRAWCVRR
jgi:hypothetical protein